MPNPIVSPTPTTDGLAAMIAKIAAALDPQFPSVVIAPGADSAIGEPAAFYTQRNRPDFVLADDADWREELV